MILFLVKAGREAEWTPALLHQDKLLLDGARLRSSPSPPSNSLASLSLSASQPASQPLSQPLSLSASQPASQPLHQPSKQPALFFVRVLGL